MLAILQRPVFPHRPFSFSLSPEASAQGISVSASNAPRPCCRARILSRRACSAP